MRTPCQADPDLWTSNNPDERWQAQQDCQGCHRLAACLQEALDNPDDRIGVRGGRDWTVSKNGGNSLAAVTCGNPHCGRVLLQPSLGRRREFCNETCRRVARSAA